MTVAEPQEGDDSANRTLGYLDADHRERARRVLQEVLPGRPEHEAAEPAGGIR